MQFSKRGDHKPRHVYRLQAAILKTADELVGESHSFALFIPNSEPLYFRANDDEQRAGWMSLLAKHTVSTVWSTTYVFRMGGIGS